MKLFCFFRKWSTFNPFHSKSDHKTMNNRINMPHTELCRDQFYHICQDIVQQIVGTDGAAVFFKPVDPVQDGAPDYYQVIVNPMCLFTIQDKLDKKLYNSPEEFINDMNQIFINAKHYNNSAHPIYKSADELANKFAHLATRLPHKIAEGGLNDGLQRQVELRLLRYRLNKTTHL
ncbi:Bromodomain containing protein [Tritrichomonas foetus]|uniref:Bromodomain containing protein n=1 Tax=Tritrichomonas foetus TaxID=1144522 RepID=A0A1J4K5R7_9EUKA|nr:Bromodomain containing protein [Tritrichomonas foetus]|eukprot:OHT06507.1 Bromodomain containing protein [Tritrichomonas foetus]